MLIDLQLQKKGFYLPSKCSCCYHTENIHHVFISGSIASHVWLWFDELYRTNYFNAFDSYMNLLNAWFLDKPEGYIHIILPIIILIFIWQDRNDYKYRNIIMSHHRIIAKMIYKIKQLYSANLISIKNFKGCKFLAATFNIEFNMGLPNQERTSRIVYC